jgi:hypothetical protein
LLAPGLRVQRQRMTGRLSSRLLPGLAAAGLVAVALRVLFRLQRGADDFWVNGYAFYFELARSLARGHGYAFDDGSPAVLRVPLYPLFLAAVTQGERSFATLVVVQALIGAGTVVCGGLLAAELFGATSGLLTAAALAVYPYYVVHDTALQETGLFTLLTVVAVLLLLRTRRQLAPGHAIGAGLVLAAAVLTRSTLVPFACLAPLWLGSATQGPLGRRLACAVLCAASLGLGLSPWLAHTRSVVGAPVLGTEAGQLFWRGNNPHTFSRYPEASMNESAALASAALSAQDRAELEGLRDDALANDRWFLERGLSYLTEHPGPTLTGAARKLAAAFGPLPSPRHGPFENLVQLCSYGPLLALALVGLALSAKRRALREHSLLYALLLSFAGVTALFFGHTSHRAFLDVYLATYASLPAAQLLERLWRPDRAAS